MATHQVTEEQVQRVDEKMQEIRRLLSLPDGSPCDPDRVTDALQRIIDGQGDPYSIDCDADPSAYDGLVVVEHKKGGLILWGPKKFALYLSEPQRVGVVASCRLLKELKSLPVMNTNVGDFCLRNPGLIPHEWKGNYIFFWGTIYRDQNGRSDGDLCVRCLYQLGDEWRWTYFRLIGDRHSTDQALILVTP